MAFYSTPSELNDDMSVLVAVIHFRVGYHTTQASHGSDCDCDHIVLIIILALVDYSSLLSKCRGISIIKILFGK